MVRKLHYFSPFTILQYLSSQPDTNSLISSWFDEGPPLAKTAISSILPYHSRPREYWTRGSCRTFGRTDIARHIKVVTLLLLLLLFWLNHVLDRISNNDIQHFLKTVDFHQKYSDIKTPAPGFQPTIRISVGRI